MGRVADESMTDDRGQRLDRLRGAMVQLAQGVSALHAEGKLHRDIKPSNVLVEQGGRVVILDFGLAEELEGSGSQHSSEPQVLGTAAYMAPEQAAGLAVSPASDWYSVGTMLYEALTGRLPFTGRPLEILLAKQRSDPPPPTGSPEDLVALCVDLLHRDPADRPPGPTVLQRLHGRTASDVVAPARSQTGQRVGLIGPRGASRGIRRCLRCRRSWDDGGTAVPRPVGDRQERLVKHCLDALRGRGRPEIFAGRCYQQESVPYKALDMVIDSLSRYLRGLPVPEAALLPRDVLLLAQIFPVLRQSEAVSDDATAYLRDPQPARAEAARLRVPPRAPRSDR